MNNPNEQLAHAIRLEMERAYDAAINVGALKQSDWWQDRKAQIAAIESHDNNGHA